ncbi:hypothetical protein Aph02nite_65280 [Actinoplanes philippinensis]|uniref:Uncharacterized protein n=1 Tax=Actinoplanes philippinensis TaxID=35752 RepID=A0A1I2LEH9_9ACTN|nr:hypothetical protein Aph02nite_65280 [Actinoplanes philippinensis]SFF76890.1 hypothetical protein SAMN05421541_12147 [Actinoplanes philippinensis]
MGVVGSVVAGAAGGAVSTFAAYLPTLPVAIATGVFATLGTAFGTIGAAAVVKVWRGARNAHR